MSAKRMPALLLAGLLVWSAQAAVQAQVRDRSIAEIKTESQARAERGAYPLGGLDPKDVREALALVNTRDPDDWAAAWSAVAERYMNAAAQAATPAEASAAYRRAWRLYYFAQWPFPSSKGKQQAYEKGLDAYLRHARSFDSPLEVVKIPFEGREIVGYLRLPPGATGPVPLILAISGLDSRKETVADSYAQILKQGVGFFAVDGPGTGQAPIKVSVNAERMFSAVLDYLQQRPEVDRTRIIVSGVSFGGYWASKLAITERSRLLGSVAQSPPVHETFSVKFLREHTLGNREYLFDLVPAFVNVFEGARNARDLARLMPAMSLQTQGLLGKPTTPMLIVGGARDTQVPIADLELLMRAGDVPKESWINPQGGHLGRQPAGWTDPVIFSKVIIPWELRLLGASQKDAAAAR